MRSADRVADLDLGETPELPDLSGGHRRTPNGRAVVEDADRRHLPFGVPAEPKPIARAHGAREHADERDLLAGRTALDLEDVARHGTVAVASGSRQQLL